MELVPANGQTEHGHEMRQPDAIKSGVYFEAGDILLSKITPSFENGKQGLARNLPHAFGFGSTEIIPLQSVGPSTLNLYLFYLLLHHEVRDNLTSKMEGSTGRKRVPEGAVRELEIPLPPKPEQEKIAAVLWKMQRAIATQDKLLKATADLKASAMQRLFTHGLRGEPLKDTEIGSVPESWKVGRFDALAVLQRGFDLPIAQRESGDVPVIGSNGVVGWHDQVRIAAPGVVTGRSGSIGESTYIEVDFWPLNTSLYVSEFQGNEPRYVHYFLQWFNLSRFKGGVSVPTLNRNMVHGSTVAIPNVDEQRAIAAALATLDRKLAHHRAKRAALADLFQTTLHRLMTAQTRVADLDIDTSDIADQFPDAGKMVARKGKR